MKCLLDKRLGRFIRVSDALAHRLVNRPNHRFNFIPKWMWKEQENLPYRGKKLIGSYK